MERTSGNGEAAHTDAHALPSSKWDEGARLPIATVSWPVDVYFW